MTTTRRIRELVVKLEREGARGVAVERTRGGHVRFTFSDARGRDHALVAPWSASDRRAVLNFVAHARRAMRQDRDDVRAAA